ncbi:unnamed protein product [Sphagnum troendelagicum]|uniref:Uncharacterized protein n=1 Tax=Sphagnum troendelagicum TaxID=128251 RepID=A0ABP0URP2_9BRYO
MTSLTPLHDFFELTEQIEQEQLSLTLASSSPGFAFLFYMYATSQDPNLTAKQVHNVAHQNLQTKVIHFPSTSIKQCCTTGLNHKSSMQNLSAEPSLYNGPGRRGAYSAHPYYLIPTQNQHFLPILKQCATALHARECAINGDSARDNPCSGRINTCHSAPTRLAAFLGGTSPNGPFHERR